MTALIIDGRKLADATYDGLRSRIARLEQKGVTPGLVVVQVGEDPASSSYIRSKTKAAKGLRVLSEHVHLPADVGGEELASKLSSLNGDPRYHGILLQLPLPDHLDPRFFTDLIDPAKDVDGFTSVSLGRLMAGEDGFIPATPRGIMEMLRSAGCDPAGKHAVILGRSVIVGRPLAMLLSRKAPGGNATVTIVHTRTADAPAHTRGADILVAAMGRAGAVTADMVKPGAVVIDVGINRVEDPSAKRGYRLVGDVDFDGVREVASAITPVPGGVGLMTVAALMANTVEAAEGTKRGL